MLWNNIGALGGNFLDQVEQEFNSSDAVTIASGYVSLDIIKKFAYRFEKIASDGGQARLLVGMAFYEGLSANKLSLLNNLCAKLENTGTGSGVFVSYTVNTTANFMYSVMVLIKGIISALLTFQEAVSRKILSVRPL